MPPKEKAFKQILDVPVNYDRRSHADYGTRGVNTTWYCTNSFYSKLENFFGDLFSTCPLGKPEVIATAGVYVNKPSSKHNEGEAFDLDALFWKDYDFITLKFKKYPQFYLGVEALLRKYFGNVLTYLYDKRHQDHFHFDSGGRIGFSSASKSKTYFVQAVCHYIFKLPIQIDGAWGELSKEAFEKVNGLLGTSYDINNQSDWLSFLDSVAARGLSTYTNEGLGAPSSIAELPDSGIVTASKLNIRAMPSAESPKVAQPLPQGKAVEIIEKQGEWYRVKTVIEGWVSAKYIDDSLSS